MSLVKGRVYNAELRNELIQAGMRRISTLQWISKDTAEKYELVLSDGEEKVIVGVDLIDGSHRIRLKDKNSAVKPSAEAVAGVEVSVHHRTFGAIMRQLEISDSYFDLMDRWNEEMYRGTKLGYQLRELVKRSEICWRDFLYLPDPMASGEYMFATFRKGVAAAMHSWLQMPDERHFVPTDGSVDGAWDSLQNGLEFHAWEQQAFDTPAAAGQYVIRMLNNSNSSYAQTIHRLLGKEDAKISRNDFYRDSYNQMCRIEVIRDAQGLHITDIPCGPTVADCLDSLLAPYIKSRALREA